MEPRFDIPKNKKKKGESSAVTKDIGSLQFVLQDLKMLAADTIEPTEKILTPPEESGSTLELSSVGTELQQQVRETVETIFSDANLAKDQFMKELVEQSPEGCKSLFTTRSVDCGEPDNLLTTCFLLRGHFEESEQLQES